VSTNNTIGTISATSAGTSSGVIFGALNNQGLYNVTKTGVGLLQLGDNTGTFTNGTFTVDAGTVRVTNNGSFGNATSTAIIDQGGTLEISANTFAPTATLVQRAGSF